MDVKHHVYLLSEGADRVSGQLRRDKECPFSGVTRSGRVWRKVPESDARSVLSSLPLKRGPAFSDGQSLTDTASVES